MEFIEFLDPIEIEIVRIIKEAGYSTEENTAICLSGKNFVGFLKKTQKIIVICTDNAKKKERYAHLRNLNTNAFEYSVAKSGLRTLCKLYQKKFRKTKINFDLITAGAIHSLQRSHKK